MAEESVSKNTIQQDRIERRRQLYRSFEAESLKHRSFFTRISDELNNSFGSTPFLIINVVWFFVWIVINLGLIPDIEPFDPFPFGLLTMALSIEAIILAIFILVSQNRQSYVSSLREELHLQVNLIAEEEVTKALEVLAEIRNHLGIKQKDPELEEMMQRIDTGYIEKTLSAQLQKANTSIAGKLVEKIKKDTPEILDPMNIVRDK